MNIPDNEYGTLRDEYDLTQLRVRKMGAGRKQFNGVDVHLEPDVAEMFPDSQSVNEALRFLLRLTKQGIISHSHSGA